MPEDDRRQLNTAWGLEFRVKIWGGWFLEAESLYTRNTIILAVRSILGDSCSVILVIRTFQKPFIYGTLVLCFREVLLMAPTPGTRRAPIQDLQLYGSIDVDVSI